MRNAVDANEHASDVELGVSSEDLFSDAAEMTFPRADNPAARRRRRNKKKRRRAGERESALALVLARFSHGVASPSGIPSVLPAVVLDDPRRRPRTWWRSSSVHREHGRVAEPSPRRRRGGGGGGGADADRDPRRESPTRPYASRWARTLAGAAAIAIGVAWLVLSATGKLGDL